MVFGKCIHAPQRKIPHEVTTNRDLPQRKIPLGGDLMTLVIALVVCSNPQIRPTGVSLRRLTGTSPKLVALMTECF